MKLEYTRILEMTTGKLLAGTADTFVGPRGLHSSDTHKEQDHMHVWVFCKEVS